MDADIINGIAEVVERFNYDYHHIDNHRNWSYWHNRKSEYMNIIRKQLSEQEKLALYHRVAELHNIAVEPYLQYGISKKFEDDETKRQNVLNFIGSIDC